ncbi:hypothetical protein [Paenarthrobacter sp. NPDC057981]|uniref:hypothetical protein n=1 Tax=Paenarthrobacter sp. NPDC057981 TaxID=3346297 RepID=UPI0036DD4309
MRTPTFTEWWYRCVIGALFCGAVAFSVFMNILGDPSHAQDHWGWFCFWAVLMVISGGIGIAIFRVKRTPNHEITWSRNGLTILGVFASALAFNFPPSWRTGWDVVPLWSTLIGWIFIVLSLAVLEPIWKTETKATAENTELKLSNLRLQDEARNRKTTVGEGSLLRKAGKAKGGKK